MSPASSAREQESLIRGQCANRGHAVKTRSVAMQRSLAHARNSCWFISQTRRTQSSRSGEAPERVNTTTNFQPALQPARSRCASNTKLTVCCCQRTSTLDSFRRGGNCRKSTGSSTLSHLTRVNARLLPDARSETLAG